MTSAGPAHVSHGIGSISAPNYGKGCVRFRCFVLLWVEPCPTRDAVGQHPSRRYNITRAIKRTQFHRIEVGQDDKTDWTGRCQTPEVSVMTLDIYGRYLAWTPADCIMCGINNARWVMARLHCLVMVGMMLSSRPIEPNMAAIETPLKHGLELDQVAGRRTVECPLLQSLAVDIDDGVRPRMAFQLDRRMGTLSNHFATPFQPHSMLFSATWIRTVFVGLVVAAPAEKYLHDNQAGVADEH